MFSNIKVYNSLKVANCVQIYVKYLTMVNNYQLLNVLPCVMQCCSPEVVMLPEASAEGNIPTKGEQNCMLHGRTFNN